ncbi:MAG: VanZ family protein [Myxococcota bacterium]
MWIRFVPAVLWALFIFALSSRSKLPQLPGTFPGIDKVAHAVVFGVLTLLLLFADRFPRGWRALLWVAVAFAYGISDELHQSLVPGRSVDVLDAVADLTGALLAWAVSHWFLSIDRSKNTALDPSS